MEKRIPDPARVRRVPEHFSWVDHRLVRDGHFKECGDEALALYLFLVAVGDADGVSWYGDGSLGGEMNCGMEKLERLRQELVEKGLIEWSPPFYQVLDLDTGRFCSSMLSRISAEPGRGADDAASIGDVIAGMLGGGRRP